MKIDFTIDEQGWSMTQCPHADFVLRVGSQVCQKCQYWFGQNQAEHHVHCLCPKGETLKTLPFYTTNVPCEDCKFANWDASLFKDREEIQWEGMLIPLYSEQFDLYCKRHERFYLEDEITGDCQDGEYGPNNLHDICKEHRRKINEFYKELKKKKEEKDG